MDECLNLIVIRAIASGFAGMRATAISRRAAQRSRLLARGNWKIVVYLDDNTRAVTSRDTFERRADGTIQTWRL